MSNSTIPDCSLFFNSIYPAMRGSANSTLSIDDCCLPEAGLYCRNSRLTQIRFSTNSLFGVIPNNIVGLDALEVIVIQNNRVSGIIPPQIGSLSLLTILDLKNNSLTGPIPSEIGNLKSLTQLFLSNNSFAGVVPKEVLALPKYVSDPNSRFFQFDSFNMPQSSSDTPSSSFNSLSIIVYFLIVLIVMLIIALVIFFIRRRRSGYKIPQEIMDINPSPHIHLNSLSPSALHSTNNSLLNRENGQRSPPYTQSSRQSQSYPMAQQTTSNNSRINPSVVVVQPHQSTNNNRFTTPITPNLPPQPRQTRRQPSILLRRTPTHNSSMMPPDETADMVPESQLVSAMTLDGDEVPSHIPSEVLSTDTVYYQPGARRRN